MRLCRLVKNGRPARRLNKFYTRRVRFALCRFVATKRADLQAIKRIAARAVHAFRPLPSPYILSHIGAVISVQRTLSDPLLLLSFVAGDPLVRGPI